MNALKNDFLETCTACGACTQACPFLERCGLPTDIVQSPEDTVFLCTNCRACEMVCPAGLSPAEVFHREKTERIRSGKLSPRVQQARNGAAGYARRGHSFPFSVWKPAQTVFWPGCGLTGAIPDAVMPIREILAKELSRRVGLVIDCCFDPLWQLGDMDAVTIAAEQIGRRLRQCGVARVVTGCVNCAKILGSYLPDITVQHALEIIPPERFSQEVHSMVLHQPCPSVRIAGLREKASRCAHEPSYGNLPPACCGCGGGLHVLDPELSAAFAAKALRDAPDKPVVTYCVGCRSTFQKQSYSAHHLFEYLPGVSPCTGRISSGRKWFNRLAVGLRMRILSPKFLVGIGLLGVIALSAWLRQHGYISMDGLVAFLHEHPVLAPLLFMLVYAIGPSIFLPSLPLTLGAGFLWGPFWGVVFSIAGATVGASVAFLLARYVMHDAVKNRFGRERWQTLSSRVQQHGWKAVAFARLVPIFPFPVLNFLFGVTPISFFHYVWSSFVFMLPACIAYVAFGSSMGELILHGNIEGLVIGIVIASVALLLPLLLKPLLKRRHSSIDQSR